MSSVTIKATSPGLTLQADGEAGPQPLHNPTREPVWVLLRISAHSAQWWCLSKNCGPGLGLSPNLLLGLGKSFHPSVDSLGKWGNCYLPHCKDELKQYTHGAERALSLGGLLSISLTCGALQMPYYSLTILPRSFILNSLRHMFSCTGCRPTFCICSSNLYSHDP